MFPMRRIPPPEWAPEWARRVAPTVEAEFGEEEYRAVFMHRAEILAAVQEAVEQYINDDDVTSNESRRSFPERRKLTGEYYIGEENYWVSTVKYHGDRPPTPQAQYLFSLMARCLEEPWLEGQTDLDYLSLSVLFEWDPAAQQVSSTCDVDSSRI